jgi:hypothetical protein
MAPRNRTDGNQSGKGAVSSAIQKRPSHRSENDDTMREYFASGATLMMSADDAAKALSENYQVRLELNGDRILVAAKSAEELVDGRCPIVRLRIDGTSLRYATGQMVRGSEKHGTRKATSSLPLTRST